MNQQSIEGLPAIDGRPLTPADLPEIGLHATDRWIALARRIRGQFSIVARANDSSVAVTDLTGSYPVFQSGARFETSLEPWTSRETFSLSSEGVSRFAAYGTAGAGCTLAAGIRSLPGAVVSIAEAGKSQTFPWLDWQEAIVPNGAPEADLQEEFKAILAGWVSVNLPPEGRIALLLSGGTDSALLGSLLKPILGDRLVSITQDFFLQRYTERSAASETARRLQLPLLDARIGRSAYYRAFLQLNASVQDAVVHSSQTQNLYCLTAFARERGIDTVITGEHADSLFLGFGHFFNGLPPGAKEYRAAIAALTPEQKLDRVAAKPPALSPFGAEVLRALGIPEADYRRWVNEQVAARRLRFAPFAATIPLPTLQQLGGQIDGGAAWREICLAVMRAMPGSRVLCPFFDSEMIRFALRLSPEWIFRDGQTKYFLRRLLKANTGLECPKRPAALSPLRFWRLLPNLREYSAVSPSLAPLYRRLTFQNGLKKGAMYNEMAMAAALGVWTKSHRLSAPAS